MTTTLSDPRPAVRPIRIIAAALLVALLVVLVLAVTVWRSGGSDVDAPAPRIETPTASGGDATATQHYLDRLQELNSTLDGYSNRLVRASSIDSGEAACGLTGPC